MILLKSPGRCLDPPTGAKSEEELAPMTTGSISPVMLAKAEHLAAQAATWHRGCSKLDGTHFYLVPGSKPGTAHYANVFGCTCPSYRNRGACSHVKACKILQRRSDAAIAAKVTKADAERQRRYEALLSVSDDDTCSTPGCTGWATISGGTCREHNRMAVAA
jgi:hypothetical protein